MKSLDHEKIELHILNRKEYELILPIVELLKYVFPNTDRTEKSFIWKHFENPNGDSIITYATLNEKIVSARAFWRGKVLKDGEEYISFQPCDTVTHPEYRRMGLFSKITLLAIEEAKHIDEKFLIYNFPNNNSAPAYKKIGWNVNSNMNAFVKLCNYKKIPQLLYHKLKGDYKFVPDSELQDNCEWSKLLSWHFTGYQVVKNVVQQLYNLDYILWRYKNHPINSYGIELYGGGAIIFRIGKRGGAVELQIVDCLTRGRNFNDKEFKHLLGVVVKKYKPDIVTIACSNSNPITGTLCKNRFFSVRNRMKIAYKLDFGDDADVNDIEFSMFSGCMDTF